ncbi:MAG: tRNA (adenosine(37)-N6)-threonylcarbamoyltransferase complex dimerization subunit type 1 TsaB [Thermodesulfobacteriota bacterium]|nr:tRNA (adenosine(37)-N6)-threonylcarbamoyltransferase complex dimerization subunit type 1 TsaB [Thermodesulfobacteriota bacterium]
MKALALDTATPAGSAALVQGSAVLAESNLPPGKTHSRTLVPEIQRLLTRLGLTVHDLDLVAVGLGPGSFTGLRIGLAVAKGLAWAAGKPLVGVPSLDALVWGLPPRPIQACPMLDARRGRVYAALYRSSGAEGAWKRQTEFTAHTLRTLAELVREETVFIGEAGKAWSRPLADELGPLFRAGPEDLVSPRAAQVARVAFDLFNQGVKTDPARIMPLYIRPPYIRPPV